MLTLTYSGLTVQYANIIFIAIVLKILKLTINVSQGFYRGHGNSFFRILTVLSRLDKISGNSVNIISCQHQGPTTSVTTRFPTKLAEGVETVNESVVVEPGFTRMGRLDDDFIRNPGVSEDIERTELGEVPLSWRVMVNV